MARRDLLPGVAPDRCRPKVVSDSREVLERSRRRAGWRDAAHLALMVLVDYLFVRWPSSHVPSLDRQDSLMIVAVVNVAVLAHVILSRWVPRWTARRIATTWCLSERARFFQRLRY